MKNLSLMMYTEINVVCIILLIYVAYKAYYNVERRKSWHYYRLTMYSFLVLNIFDMLWLWCDSDVLPLGRTAIYLVYSIYDFFATLSTVLWLFYVEDEMDTGLVQSPVFRALALSPAVLVFILLFVSYFNGCVFYLDENLSYHRGTLIWVPFLCPILLFALSCLHATTHVFRKKYYICLRNNIALMISSFVIICAYVIQMTLPGTPIQCMVTTAAMLGIYMVALEMQVTLDPLTKLNNRQQMERYLMSRLEAPAGTALYLLILDVDSFKHINDSFGHVEGDKALIRLAGVLKKAEEVFHCFVSRYGGDEFIVVHEAAEDGEIDRLVDFIRQSLEQSNHAAMAAYPLSVSLGYARRTEKTSYVQDMIAEADEALYEAKKLRKSKRQSRE